MSSIEIADVIAKFHIIHNPNDNSIIIGDFNFAEFDIDKGKNMDYRDKLIKPMWDDVLSKNAIIDPFRVQCPKKRIFSYSTSQGKSRGDRIYVNEDSIGSVKKLRHIYTPFLTAHKMMTFDFQFGRKIGPSTWKMISSALNDPIFMTEIEDIFKDLQSAPIEDPRDWWDMFIMVVHGTTISYTRRKAKINTA